MAKSEFEKDTLKLKMLAASIGRLVRQDIEKRLEAENLGITGLGLGVLHIICHHECTISELSTKMFIASATIVPVIDALERDGFIERKSDPNDRRRNPLALTAKGKAIASKLLALEKNDLASIALKKMGKKKTKQLIEILCEFVDSLSDEPNYSEKILQAIDNREKFNHCFEEKPAKKN